MVYSVIQHEFFIRFWVINFSYFLYRSSHVSSPETVFISHEINENYLLSFTNSYLTSILLGVIYIYIYIYIEYGKAVNRLATLLQKDISIINQTFQILSCHFARATNAVPTTYLIRWRLRSSSGFPFHHLDHDC